MQIDLTLETKLKIQELESQGFEINFFTEEKNFKTTGPYTAYYAEIKKMVKWYGNNFQGNPLTKLLTPLSLLGNI